MTKANINHSWYSYEEKRWANAVILEDESITYQDGEEIPESNIESYFVWIPKYSYQLWDLGNYTSATSIDESKAHEIPIKFGLENTSDEVDGECTTPMNEEKNQGLSGESGNCKIGDYMTSPAFISMGTNGLWVGKFETGYNGSSIATNLIDPTKVQIKPNVLSWIGSDVYQIFENAYQYKREYDSHMIKNTEWGAIAYLTNSEYGRCSENICDEITRNNNNKWITGYAANNSLSYEEVNASSDGRYTYNYKNPLSQVASTTGNYTGIYDMSGGTFEYVMGVVVDGSPFYKTSGFTDNTFPKDLKYYDAYKSTNVFNYKCRILGDATGEMGPFSAISSYQYKSSWYNDQGHMILPDIPWFSRGGNAITGNESGLFQFYPFHGNKTGGVGTVVSSRIVLSIS